MAVAVQYRVLEEGAYAAYYRLTDPRGQIQSYVFDVVRSTVPRMELDEAFASKDDIAEAVLAQLKDVMVDYGYVSCFLVLFVLFFDVDYSVKLFSDFFLLSNLCPSILEIVGNFEHARHGHVARQ